MGQQKHGRDSADKVALWITGKTSTFSVSGDNGEDTTYTPDKKYLIIAKLIADLTGKEIAVYGGRGPEKGRRDRRRASGSCGSASQPEGWGLRCLIRSCLRSVSCPACLPCHTSAAVNGDLFARKIGYELGDNQILVVQREGDVFSVIS